MMAMVTVPDPYVACKMWSSPSNHFPWQPTLTFLAQDSFDRLSLQPASRGETGEMGRAPDWPGHATHATQGFSRPSTIGPARTRSCPLCREEHWPFKLYAKQIQDLPRWRFAEKQAFSSSSPWCFICVLALFTIDSHTKPGPSRGSALSNDGQETGKHQAAAHIVNSSLLNGQMCLFIINFDCSTLELV